MKKTLLLSLGMFASIFSFAQYNQSTSIIKINKGTGPTLQKQSKDVAGKKISRAELAQNSTKKTRASKRYFSFPFDMDQFLTDNAMNPLVGDANLDVRYMWQDSTTVRVPFSNGLSAPETQSLSQVLDPYAARWNSSTFNGLPAVKPNVAYNVDSFAIVGIYTRKPNLANVVDTLEFRFIKGAQMGLLQYPDPLYPDTVKFAAIKTTYASRGGISTSTSAPTVTTIKYPLAAGAENDTLSNGWNYFAVPVNLSVTNDIVGVTVTFLTGEAGIPANDSIGKHNNFRFATFGEGTDDGSGGLDATAMYYAKNDFNMSGNTWTKAPTSITVTGNNYFYPAIYYMDAVATNIIPWEYHWFEWTISGLTGTVSTNDVNENILASNVYPSPADNELNVSLNTVNAAKNVTVSIVSVTGQTLMSNTIKNNSNNIRTKFDISNLTAGMYMCTINADGAVKTQKFIKK